MIKNFTNIAFTNSVKEIQRAKGSRNNYLRMEQMEMNTLFQSEIDFIESRDMFYMSTVSENGWPYVQFRGGPKGFLKVLSPKQIGFADYRGNMQYVSTGNLTSNNKVALILMDYPTRTRLKIWADTKIISLKDNELGKRLIDEDYPIQLEHFIIMDVKAFDWNCPRHIKPRYTEEEIYALLNREDIDIDCTKSRKEIITNLRKAKIF